MFENKSALSRRLRSGGLFSSLAAAAAAAAVGGPALMTAGAGILYSGVRNLNSSGQGTPVNADNTGVPEFLLKFAGSKGSTFLGNGSWGPQYRLWSTGMHSITFAQNVRFAGFSGRPGVEVSRLREGLVIGRDSSLFSGTGTVGSYTSRSGPPSSTGWPSGEGLLGFCFPSRQGRTLYGWARLRIGSSYALPGSVKLIDWAYEDSGAFIRAGQMPPPKPEPVPPPVIQGIRLAEGGNVTLTWSGGGVLQRAETPAGPFTDIPAAVSPHTAPAGASPRGFFRVRQSGPPAAPGG